MNLLGLLEYAWSLLFEKDVMKTRFILSSRYRFPHLFCDDAGFVCIVPQPVVLEGARDSISLLGFVFPATAEGKRHLVSLFRGAVYHLGAHVITSKPKDFSRWARGKNSLLVKFVTSLIEDTKIEAFVAHRYPEKLKDLAFANALALRKLRPVGSFVNPATRMMTSLLVQSRTGPLSDFSVTEEKFASHLAERVSSFREQMAFAYRDRTDVFADEQLRLASEVYSAIEDAGPITEAPFFPHTEEVGRCTVFRRTLAVDSDTMGDDFRRCCEFLGVEPTMNADESLAAAKIFEAEAIQAFDSSLHQEAKERELVMKRAGLLEATSFKSLEVAEQDYSESVRVRARSKTEAHRLIETLLVARDAIDEDPRKIYGVLDLQEVIQVVASKSPRMDVFMLDENLSKSYSWIILLDASRSMRFEKDFALEVFLMLMEAANEVLIDPSSWAAYAFNDRLVIIKDFKERYSMRVKSRAGGIRFDGSTYLPDALEAARSLMRGRSENMRLLTLISDGLPLGYANMDRALSEAILGLQASGISTVGIGARSRRMASLLGTGCAAYTLRDLSKGFANLFFEASRTASES